MPALLPDHSNQRPTSDPKIVRFFIAGLIGLMIGVAGWEMRSHGSIAPPQGRLAVAERAFRRGDDQVAFAMFSRLAKKGNATAEYWLARMTERGLGVSRSPTKAVEWYTKAAQQNVIPADVRLGEIYLYGNLVPPDPTRAKAYLEKAAYKGNAHAAMLLGQMYRVGIGGARNQKNAYAWFDVATLEGSAFAKREREVSFRALSEADQPSVIAKAQKIIKTIKNKSPSRPNKLQENAIAAAKPRAGSGRIS